MAIEKAYGVTLRPRRDVAPEQAELEQELAELQEIEAKKLRNAERHRDPIAELLGSKICRRNHSFWFIQHRGLALRVSHFFPDKNIALDVFETIGPNEQQEITFKRQALRTEGVKYAALDYSMDVAEILPQVNKLKLWPFGRK